MSTHHPLAIHNPTGGQYEDEMGAADAARILARWIRELRCERARLQTDNLRLAAQVTELEHQVSGFAFWMRTARTPARIKDLAEAVA